MHPSSRRFLQTLSAGALAAGLPRWAYARSFDPSREQAPAVRDPKYREWSTRRARRGEAARLLVRRHPLHAQPRAEHRACATARSCAPAAGSGPRGDATETYGFGVRVIHSGVWGFASSPLVTPEEIKRVTGVATDVARASAVAKKRDVQLAPVPAYDEFWQVPIQKDPWEVPLEEKIDMLRGVTATMQKNPSVLFAVATVGFEHEWKYLATSEGSFIEQVFHFTNCNARRDRAHRQPGQDAQLRAARRRRLRVPRAGRSARQRRARRRRSGRALDGQAGRARAQGSRPDAVAPRR